MAFANCKIELSESYFKQLPYEYEKRGNRPSRLSVMKEMNRKAVVEIGNDSWETSGC